MASNYDGAVKPADVEDVAAAIFESPGQATDSALTFTREFAFLFNGNAAMKKEGLQAIDLMFSGVAPEVAVKHAFDNLQGAALKRQMN